MAASEKDLTFFEEDQVCPVCQGWSNDRRKKEYDFWKGNLSAVVSSPSFSFLGVIAAEMHFQANRRVKLVEMPNGRRRGAISKSEAIK